MDRKSFLQQLPASQRRALLAQLKDENTLPSEASDCCESPKTLMQLDLDRYPARAAVQAGHHEATGTCQLCGGLRSQLRAVCLQLQKSTREKEDMQEQLEDQQATMARHLQLQQQAEQKLQQSLSHVASLQQEVAALRDDARKAETDQRGLHQHIHAAGRERDQALDEQHQLEARVQQLQAWLVASLDAAAAATVAGCMGSSLQMAAELELTGCLMSPDVPGSSAPQKPPATMQAALAHVSSLTRQRDQLQREVRQLTNRLESAAEACRSTAHSRGLEAGALKRGVASQQVQLLGAQRRLQHLAAQLKQRDGAIKEKDDYIFKLEYRLLQTPQAAKHRRSMQQAPAACLTSPPQPQLALVPPSASQPPQQPLAHTPHSPPVPAAAEPPAAPAAVCRLLLGSPGKPAASTCPMATTSPHQEPQSPALPAPRAQPPCAAAAAPAAAALAAATPETQPVLPPRLSPCDVASPSQHGCHTPPAHGHHQAPTLAPLPAVPTSPATPTSHSAACQQSPQPNPHHPPLPPSSPPPTQRRTSPAAPHSSKAHCGLPTAAPAALRPSGLPTTLDGPSSTTTLRVQLAAFDTIHSQLADLELQLQAFRSSATYDAHAPPPAQLAAHGGSVARCLRQPARSSTLPQEEPQCCPASASSAHYQELELVKHRPTISNSSSMPELAATPAHWPDVHQRQKSQLHVASHGDLQPTTTSRPTTPEPGYDHSMSHQPHLSSGPTTPEHGYGLATEHPVLWAMAPRDTSSSVHPRSGYTGSNQHVTRHPTQAATSSSPPPLPNSCLPPAPCARTSASNDTTSHTNIATPLAPAAASHCLLSAPCSSSLPC